MKEEEELTLERKIEDAYTELKDFLFLLVVTFVIFCHCIVAKMLLGLCNYDVVLFSYVKC